MAISTTSLSIICSVKEEWNLGRQLLRASICWTSLAEVIICVSIPCYSRSKLVSSPLAEKEEGPPKLISSLTLLDGRSAQAGEADLSCTGQDLNSSQGLECESPPLHPMWGPHSLSSLSSALYIIIMAIIIIITRPKPAYGRQGLAGCSLRAVCA